MFRDKSNAWLLRIIIFLTVIAAVLVAFAVYKETYKKIQIENEINSLKKEAEKIKKDNSELSEKLSYLESKDFQEKEAKDKLNLQTPSENLVIVRPNLIKTEKEEENKEPEKVEITVKKSNIQKWWEYFFKR